MEEVMDNKEIKGFIYNRKNSSSFDIIGFTKIVNSGGELYDEVRQSNKWEILKNLNVKNKTLFGVASHDKECTEGKYRYTMGIKKDENYVEDKEYIEQLFSINISESEWIIFTMDFENEYGKFWGNNPYQLIDEIGFSFNDSVGLHIDVFGEDYNGHKMEFWMPIKEKTS
jgi:hypothetical protein